MRKKERIQLFNSGKLGYWDHSVVFAFPIPSAALPAVVSAEPGNLMEMQNLRSDPQLVNDSLGFDKVPSWSECK